ncbi:MAG: hypothetical protein HFI07_08670 [Lachnospiraceae bacterium]|jgi:hypothetical protein|nr:hypothetical protein [Lachnospiraceae bacterium]
MIEKNKLLGVLLALAFWGIAFPQYVFTGDCVRIFDRDGKEVTEEREDENLYREISTAKPEQIEIKISFLERAER